jgi:excisionase family DNA binding protein
VSPSRQRRLPPSTSPDWLSLGEASAVLGVSSATLRRWSDAGRVRSFTTPGGHRRFSRATLQRMLPAERDHRPAVANLGVTPQRMVRRYRDASRRPTERPSWIAALGEAERSAFRELGRAVAAHLLLYLDADADHALEARDHQLHEARARAAEYGRRTAQLGLTLSQGVEAFLRFRAPFIAELASVAPRRGLHAAEATELLQAAEQAMDVLLVAMMTGHSVATASRVTAEAPRS